MISKVIVSVLAFIILFCGIMITWGISAHFFPVLGSEQLIEKIAQVSGIIMLSITGVGIVIYTIVLISEVVLDVWRE